MKIYINNVLVKAEILPANTPTLDETLETFSFALISNTQPLPYAPMQKVKVDFLGDGTDVAYFYIVSDSVDTYSLNPVKYKHSISCIQNTRKLSKHLVRNSVFSQPANPIKNSYNAESAYGSAFSSGADITWNTSYIPSLNWKSEKLKLSSREKLKNAKLKISFQFATNQGDNHDRPYYQDKHTVAQILDTVDLVASLSIANSFTLKYKNSNNVDTTETITPSDFGASVFDLNVEYEFPRIKELAEQGCNDFEILFPTLNFLTGTFKTSGEITEDTRGYIAMYMIQVQIEAETYYNSCFDVLNLLLERQKKETTINSLPALFSLPQSGDLYNLLTKTIAPNFTFTELTMYECVAEVFRVFDAIFTMTDEGELGIEYFNDLSQTRINPKITGRNLSLSEDKYTNGLVSYYQDGRTKETFPDDVNFAYLRSAEFGVPEPQDHSFIVPHSIQSIVKCELLFDEMKMNNEYWRVYNDNGISIDITRQVVERDVWSVLDVGTMTNDDWDNRTVKQCNSVYFVKGDNKIQVAYSFKSSWNITQYALYLAAQTILLRMSGMDEAGEIIPGDMLKGDWYKIRMRLTYTTTVDGVTKVHSVETKYNGETLVDQYNGAVDLNKMGLNMLGLSLKLGNPTLNATHKITSWSNRIKTGQLYEYQGKLWIANVVNYTFLNGYIQGKISFVQNFNQLSLRTQLMREKRMTNISRELVQKSEEIITDFVYYSTSNISSNAQTNHFNKSYLLDGIANSFYSYSSVLTKIKETVLYEPTDSAVLKINAIYIPLVKYGAGNTINFEMTFDSPMSAGNKTTATTGSWIATQYFTSSVNYTDEEGFLDEVNIKAPFFPVALTRDFPKTQAWNPNHPLGFLSAGASFDIKSFKVKKQPNEIFALNYQLAFLPYNKEIDFVGSEFINNNFFVNDLPENRKCYICFKEEKSSFLDVKAYPYSLKKQITSITVDNYKLTFNFSSITNEEKQQTKSWCIVDSNENILFSSNHEIHDNAYVTIYFVPRKERIV